MYVQGYLKKELFINFFSLQPLQAILFFQYLQFSKKGRAGGGKRIFTCRAQTHSSETDYAETKIWYLACCKERNTSCSDRLHMFFELVGAI